MRRRICSYKDVFQCSERFRKLCLTVILLAVPLPTWAGMNTWTSGGSERGVIGSITLSPAYATDATVFVRTDNGGIYKSTNGGTSWTQSMQRR